MAAAIVDAAKPRDDLLIVATIGPETPEWGDSLPHFLSLTALPAVPALVIDFSLPDGTLSAAKWCAQHDVALLTGVTGLPAPVIDALDAAADRVPVLWSPNLSLGVNLLAALVGKAAAVLEPDTPVTIEDIHHQWKKDAPSGTALMLGDAISSNRDEGAAVEFSSIREGEEIGVHTVTFVMEGEEIDLVHRAHSRSIYASGSLSAAKWLIKQHAGRYSARDWLAGRLSTA